MDKQFELEIWRLKFDTFSWVYGQSEVIQQHSTLTPAFAKSGVWKPIRQEGDQPSSERGAAKGHGAAEWWEKAVGPSRCWAGD